MCAEVCYSKSKPCFYGFPTFNVFDSSALLHAAGKLNENNIFFIVVTKMFMFSTRICEIQLYITKWHLQGFLLFFLLVCAQIWDFGSFLYISTSQYFCSQITDPGLIVFEIFMFEYCFRFQCVKKISGYQKIFDKWSKISTALNI